MVWGDDRRKVALPELQYEEPVRVCDKCHMKLQRKEFGGAATSVSGNTGSKLVVLGQTGAGKSSLINRFINGNFAEEAVPTVG